MFLIRSHIFRRKGSHWGCKCVNVRTSLITHGGVKRKLGSTREYTYRSSNSVGEHSLTRLYPPTPLHSRKTGQNSKGENYVGYGLVLLRRASPADSRRPPGERPPPAAAPRRRRPRATALTSLGPRVTSPGSGRRAGWPAGPSAGHRGTQRSRPRPTAAARGGDGPSLGGVQDIGHTLTDTQQLRSENYFTLSRSRRKNA